MVNSYKYLGNWLDSKQTFQSHVEHLTISGENLNFHTETSSVFQS